MKYPNLFAAVSAHSPALIEKLPKINVSGDQAAAVAAELGKAFGSKVDVAFWERESPFTIVKKWAAAGGLADLFRLRDRG